MSHALSLLPGLTPALPAIVATDGGAACFAWDECFAGQGSPKRKRGQNGMALSEGVIHSNDREERKRGHERKRNGKGGTENGKGVRSRS